MTADSLVVDIGGDTGALIVYALPDLVGQEIEITRAEMSSGHPVHNVVRPRRVGPRVVFAAVFPDVPAGTYSPYRKGVTDGPAFTVAGGHVTEIDWSQSAPVARTLHGPAGRHTRTPT
ncbi:MAG TPA: hypothetical protein VK585_17980 [Jiangellaceae bacterium]|nr:hypothetical protein [Jiangellaceae bacterium]